LQLSNVQLRRDETGIRAHPDSGLSVQQASQLHDLLLQKRGVLLAGRESRIERGSYRGERITEEEEAAQYDALQSTAIDLAESERWLLHEVDRALQKLQNHTYGISEESDEPIGYDRLRAVPWARYTVAEQEQLEREARGRRR
jgi:DnaK suppressor protein